MIKGVCDFSLSLFVACVEGTMVLCICGWRTLWPYFQAISGRLESLKADQSAICFAYRDDDSFNIFFSSWHALNWVFICIQYRCYLAASWAGEKSLEMFFNFKNILIGTLWLIPRKIFLTQMFTSVAMYNIGRIRNLTELSRHFLCTSVNLSRTLWDPPEYKSLSKSIISYL